jgi:hypothetical protein
MEEIKLTLPDYMTFELLTEALDFGIANALESKQRADYRQLKSDILKSVDHKYRN